MIRCILIIATVIFCFSCKERMPSGIIKPGKMQAVLWDVFKADALAQEITKRDSSKILTEENVKLTTKVFSIHNITKEQFEKSYSYYSQHPEVFRTMLDSISAQQTRISTSAAALQHRFAPDSVK